MEYIALYIRPYKRCQYKKNFNCFWCVFLIWKCLQTCHLPPSRLPFYWTPLFFVILGLFFLLSCSVSFFSCHPRACPGDLWIVVCKFPTALDSSLLCHPRTSVARSGDLWIAGSSPAMTRENESAAMTIEKENPAMTSK